MSRRLRLAWSGLAVVMTFAFAAPAQAGLVWGKRRESACEVPSIFYSNRHASGVKPCCPSDDGVCPGGTPCPASGVCAVGATKCVPSAVDRPSIVLVISDDQGE